MAPKADFTPTPARRSDGAISGLRQQLKWETGTPFRILSIDGGGIKGLFPGSYLSELERSLKLDHSVGDHFDLITGTSTGGIMALGLALGLPASKIMQIYLEHGEAIFPPIRAPFIKTKRAVRFFTNLSRYAYEREPLKLALEATFGDRLLGDAQRRLCIPAFDGNYNEVHVFKTPHHPDFGRDWKERAVDVALATAAAPTFFSVYKDKGRLFADGGVWANNPVMIGLVDALSTLDLARRDVHILSLGCGEGDQPFKEGQIKAGGLWHWREIMTAAMNLAGQNALGQAGLLIGRDQLIRIEPDIASARIKMDDFDAASHKLPAAGVEAAQASLERVRHFFDVPAATAPAFHGPRAE